MKLLLMVLFAFSTAAFAQEMTKIDASYRCEREGGGVAFREFSRTSPARVWQTDPGEEEGLELEVTDFKVARCPGCYTFEAKLGDVLKVRGSVRDFRLTYDLQDPEEGVWQTVLENVECKRVK